ncbi:hypothetical protein [Streptomyces lunaelactis]|uniref:hypothetical protein n=1 Tax=Streptomyces lunaelactis TaxID=1535768 RepID=UPI00158468C5|nr:hypothetical protein [Streptomyces lunaelactis]NUK01778.1 hypothetical protein [Streptomyces lunaelactis]NUK14986.1 hypothetical protein [Streptomyces lunaelactis]
MYEYHPWYIIGPTPDPIGPEEQAVIDEYSPKVEELAKLVEETKARFDETQGKHFDTLLEMTRSGVQPGKGAPLIVNSARMDAALNQTKRLSGRAARKLQETEESLRSDLDSAEHDLRRAVTKDSALQGRYDHLRNRARDMDKAAAEQADDRAGKYEEM